MPESISSPHLAIAEANPSVDFACCWRTAGEVWYVYRVPSHQFLLVESGRIRARTPRGEVAAGPGELLCLRREARNEYGFSGEVRYWEAHMSFAPPPRQAQPLWIDGAPMPDRVALGDHADSARRAFEVMCLELNRAGDLHALRVRGAALELLGSVAAALGREPARRPRADAWEQTRARLESRLREALTLDALARDLGITEDHLIRGFRRRFGMSPMAYRARARLRWASEALTGGRRSVKEVAHDLGFADASAFARAFRRHFGLSPTEMRVAAASGAPPPAPEAAALPFPVNVHVRPPGVKGFFHWG
jgi:AraC-like DNA-binding protein